MGEKTSNIINKGIKIFAVLYALFILKQCCGIFYTKMTHMSASDLEWVRPASRYMHVTFRSDSGNQAQLTILHSYVNNDTNPFYISSSKDTYEANAAYEYVVDNYGSGMDGRFSIARSLKNDSLVYNASLNKFGTWRHILLKPESIDLNGRQLENCLVVDSINGSHPPYYLEHNIEVKNPVSKFIISKDYGLVYFRYKTGEEFYRDF